MDYELEHEYDAELGERRELSSGSVKYPIKIKCKDTGDLVVDTTYTVSKRQEENLKDMVRRFTQKRAKEDEQDLGIDHSNENISV